jgi:hypothetical protein
MPLVVVAMTPQAAISDRCARWATQTTVLLLQPRASQQLRTGRAPVYVYVAAAGDGSKT